MSDGVGFQGEQVEAISCQLHGTIANELGATAPAFSADNHLLLRFHGIYQQDDRCPRAQRRQQGLGPDHICMARLSIPGGVLAPEFDDLLTWAVQALRSERLWVNPDCGLKTRSWAETREALAGMVAATRRACVRLAAGSR